MKPIMARCDDLCGAVERLTRATDAHRRAETLAMRGSELRVRRETLVRSLAPAQVLRAHGHLDADTLPDGTNAGRALDAVSNRLAEDPMQISKGRSFKALLKHVDDIASAIDAATTAAWRAVVAAHRGADGAFLDRLEAVPGQAVAVAEIRRLDGEFARAARTVPRSEDEYAGFVQCHQRVQAALARVDPEHFPADVTAFFKAAQRSEGAPLSMLTPTVRAWLEEHELLDGVRVRFMSRGT